MSGLIFISYRREDSSYAAGRLYDRLSQYFGSHRIFMDIDTIELGVDFVRKIEDAVGRCDVLVAVIGRQWLTVKNNTGQDRLADPNDFVRLEILAALNRNIHVIPALIDGAVMPRAVDLPEPMVSLSRRNGLEIGHQRFNDDVNRLIRGIESILEIQAKDQAATTKTVVDNPKNGFALRSDESSQKDIHPKQKVTSRAREVAVDKQNRMLTITPRAKGLLIGAILGAVYGLISGGIGSAINGSPIVGEEAIYTYYFRYWFVPAVIGNAVSGALVGLLRIKSWGITAMSVIVCIMIFTVFYRSLGFPIEESISRGLILGGGSGGLLGVIVEKIKSRPFKMSKPG